MKWNERESFWDAGSRIHRTVSQENLLEYLLPNAFETASPSDISQIRSPLLSEHPDEPGGCDDCQARATVGENSCIYRTDFCRRRSARQWTRRRFPRSPWRYGARSAVSR